MRLASLLLLSSGLLITAGCSPKDDNGLGSGASGAGATNFDETDTAAGDSGSTGTTGGTDTATGTTDDGWPDPQETNGPSQRDPDCFFEDFPNIGWVINCYVDIRDSQENLEGGTLELTASGGEFGKRASAEFDVGTFDSSTACEACIDGDQVTGAEMNFAVAVQSTSNTYDLIWLVKDASGNESNELEITVE